MLRAWDGNTVLIEGGLSVRYIGVLTPGAGMFGRPVEPFGREAAERNVALVEGQRVEIEQDASDVDGGGFLLRYVYVEGVLVNDVLLREGLAQLGPLGSNTRYRAQLQEAEATARNTPLNVWTLPTPTPLPTSTPSPTATLTPTPQPSPTGTGGPTLTPGTRTSTPTLQRSLTPVGTVLRT